MSLTCSDVKTLYVMRAKSLFVVKNSGLSIIDASYTPLPPELSGKSV